MERFAGDRRSGGPGWVLGALVLIVGCGAVAFFKGQAELRDLGDSVGRQLERATSHGVRSMRSTLREYGVDRLEDGQGAIVARLRAADRAADRRQRSLIGALREDALRLESSQAQTLAAHEDRLRDLEGLLRELRSGQLRELALLESARAERELALAPPWLAAASPARRSPNNESSSFVRAPGSARAVGTPEATPGRPAAVSRAGTALARVEEAGRGLASTSASP